MLDQRFSNDLNGLINSYVGNGVPVPAIVAALELAKLDLVRNVQDAIREQQHRIVKANQIPPINGARG